MNLSIEREHIIPYVCSPIFVPPCNNAVPPKHRKAFRNGIGRKMSQAQTLIQKKLPIDTISSSTQAPTIFTVF